MRWLALCVLLFAPIQSRAAEFEPKSLDTVIEKAMKDLNVPGAAVVIVQDDKVVYCKGFGVREKEKPEKVTENTVFAIASCSKAFTATLIAMLVDQGKLKWDDKVREHFESFRLSDELADRDVTLRDLLCHRTGMPRHDMLWAGLNLDSTELIRLWSKGKPSSSFRSTWEYSNVPYTTAGVIGGRFEKTDWAGAIQKRIFEPLQMKSSSAKVKGATESADHATPHYAAFDKTISTVKWDDIDHAGGAGCVNSTATDMGNWLRFQLAGGKFGDKRLISDRILKETHTAQMLFRPEGPFTLYFPPKATRFSSYGLGWFVHDYRGFDCVSHGGTLTGFRAQCMMVPDKKVGVFVACNLRPSVFPEAIAKTALDQLLGLPVEDWVKENKTAFTLFEFNTAVRLKRRESERKPDTKPSLALKAFAGKYDETAYGRAEVTCADDKLTLKWGKFTFRLEHYHYDTFTAVPIEPKEDVISFDRSTFDVQFRLATNGDVEGMKFLEQEFRKAKK